MRTDTDHSWEHIWSVGINEEIEMAITAGMLFVVKTGAWKVGERRSKG